MMLPENVILNHIDESPFKDFVLPIVVIYNKPLDFPEHYVGRIWNVNHPSKFIVLADTYEELVKKLPHWMVRLEENPYDNPCIMETWI